MIEPLYQRMHVSFGLFLGDTLLHRGKLLIGKAKGYSCYGEHKHFTSGSEGLEIHLFSGLLIEHEFKEPACPLSMRLLQVVDTGDPALPYRQEQVFEAALQMGVHRSDDWESVQLDKHTLGFRCIPLP